MSVRKSMMKSIMKKRIFVSLAIILISTGAIARYSLLINKADTFVAKKPIKMRFNHNTGDKTLKSSYVRLAKKKDEFIKLYFPNGHRLKVEKRSGENTAENALKMLLQGPKDKGNESFIPKGAYLLNFKLSGNKAVVNFSKQILSPGSTGAEDEELTMYSITNTLTEFSEIKEVLIQVEGKTEGELDGRFIEDFWGHVGLYDQPFKRNEALIK